MFQEKPTLEKTTFCQSNISRFQHVMFSRSEGKSGSFSFASAIAFELDGALPNLSSLRRTWPSETFSSPWQVATVLFTTRSNGVECYWNHSASGLEYVFRNFSAMEFCLTVWHSCCSLKKYFENVIIFDLSNRIFHLNLSFDLFGNVLSSILKFIWCHKKLMHEKFQ